LFIGQNFRYLRNNLKYLGIESIDGLIADLGLSSHHLDIPERGFSFSHEAKLDMRMNSKASLTAEEVVQNYSEEKLVQIFSSYGEVRNSKRLAQKIVESRGEKPVESIQDFIQTIRSCIPAKFQNKYLAQVFQALRIEVNKELDCLEDLLMQCTELIQEGGRLVMNTYQSLEDRIVKNFMRTGNTSGAVEKDFYGNVEAPFDPVNKKVIIAGKDEIENNSRARSAKLRIARKI